MGDKETEIVTAGTAGELARSFPYAPQTDTMKLYEVDAAALYGACDPYFKNLDSRLVPWRVATAFVRATRNAGPPVFYDLAAGQTFNLFSQGETDAGSGAGISDTLTNVETNAQKGGGLVQNDQLFFTVGVGVTILQPFAVTPAATPSIATKISLPELDDPTTGYARRLVRQVAQNFFGVISHGNGACDYKTGPIDAWGSSSIANDAKSSEGIPGQFWYTSVPDVSTGTAQSNALAVQLSNPRAVQVRENALSPITAGLDVLIPIRMVLFGFPACSPGRVQSSEVFRAINSMSMEERAMLRKALLAGG
jgi:hypothetical protein